MNKKQIIQFLEEMSVLLDLSDANPFKVRAFSTAARALQGTSEDVEKLVSEKKLTSIKGIGKGIAEGINEFFETGSTEEFKLLKNSIPASVLNILKIPGMGPKKVRAVWKILNITTVGELEYACNENRLVDLEGFGAKTQQKILNGISLLKKYSESRLLSDALSEAEYVINEVREIKGVIRAEIAGSVRRGKETIKDIDLVAASEDQNREAIMTHFTGLNQVESIAEKGPTKSRITLKSGINTGLQLVKNNEFPFALLHSTGSKVHNVEMKRYAANRNLKLNEYGLFGDNHSNITCQDESVIYEQLGLQYIPPELREGYGEIQAAEKNTIPQLINLNDIRGVIHCHTQYSDGANSIGELVEATQKKGYEYLVVSDHSKSAFYANGLSDERIEEQHREIEEINKNLNNFSVLKSIECDILPDGDLDYREEVLEKFDLVIASIHSRFKMTDKEATQRIIKAMESRYITILGHPTGRLLLARESYPVDMNRVLEAAAELNVAIELNANPHRLDIDWRLLKRAKALGVKISINPDAHQIDGIDDIRYGVIIARKGWLSRSDVLNTLSASQLITFSRSRNSAK